jgi:membrane protein
MAETAEQISNPPPKHKYMPSFLVRAWRVAYDATRGFIEDDCYAKASALTFYTLLSIVPVFAVLFGIAKGFGFEKALEEEITTHFYEQQEIVDKLIQFAYSWLHSVQGGVIAGIGIVVLLWSVFGLLNNIETALNSIWKTRVSRTYSRKISDYLATMLIAPIFLVTASSINVFLNTQLAETSQSNIYIEVISPFLVILLKLIPFFLIWFLFTFVYIFMPNTKVYFRSAIIAGILAGSAFQIWQYFYIKFQIGASSYGAIYGSFAAFPLFLIWLQISWMILLGGAEFAFAIENDMFIPARKVEPLSNKTIALMITYRCVEAFVKGKSPLTDRVLAHELGMSLNHLHMILEALQHDRIIAAISFRDKAIGYQPARAVDDITMFAVCEAIEKSHLILASVGESHQFEKIKSYMKHVEETLEDPKINHVLYTYVS